MYIVIKRSSTNSQTDDSEVDIEEEGDDEQPTPFICSACLGCLAPISVRDGDKRVSEEVDKLGEGGERHESFNSFVAQHTNQDIAEKNCNNEHNKEAKLVVREGGEGEHRKEADDEGGQTIDKEEHVGNGEEDLGFDSKRKILPFRNVPDNSHEVCDEGDGDAEEKCCLFPPDLLLKKNETKIGSSDAFF